MKLSMSAKIFSVVILLILLAIFITCLGVYSLSAMSTATGRMARLSYRADLLNNMDKEIMLRQMAVDEVLNTNDDETKQNIINGQLRQTAEGMEKDMQAYFAAFPPNAASGLQTTISNSRTCGTPMSASPRRSAPYPRKTPTPKPTAPRRPSGHSGSN